MSEAIAQSALLRVAEHHSLDSVSKRLAVLPDTYLAELAEVERQLARIEADGAGPAVEVVRHLIGAGGKRVRPIVCLLSGRAFPPREPGPELLPLAQVAELMHCASLLHDDVIDVGDFRRARPAPRVVFGNAASVLGGDLLLVRAVALTEAAKIPKLFESMITVLRRMVESESRQLEFRGRTDVTEEDYFAIVDGKTAALFEWSAEAGARAAGAPEALVSALKAFAHEMGVAFQLADDVLDLLQDPVVAGKAVQQDLRVGTLTFPVIRAARNRPALRVRLREIGTGDEEEDRVSSIVEAIEQAGGIRAGRQEIARRTELARSALRALPKSPAREAMAGLVSHLANRAR